MFDDRIDCSEKLPLTMLQVLWKGLCIHPWITFEKRYVSGDDMPLIISSLMIIASLIDAISPEEPKSTVIFVSIPPTVASLGFPNFRQLLLFFQRLRSTRPSILFHLISDQLTLHVLKFPKSRYMGMDQVACRIYDRLLHPVKRPMRSRFALLPGFGNPEEYFHAPSYTLVGPDPSFQMSAASKYTLGVTERHMLFHFAYRLSACERWLAVTCVDQAGHATNVKVWALGDIGEGSEYNRATNIVQRLWSFIIECARMADIEWRIIISKVGDMEEVELQGTSKIHLRLMLLIRAA